MQLILGTENTNISISEKMSSLEQETGDIPVSNGEVKELLEEINIKSEESINDKKIENKENVTANAEDPKEAGDSTTPQASNGDSTKLTKTEELRNTQLQCENNLIQEITMNAEKPENSPSEIKNMGNRADPSEKQKEKDIVSNTTRGLPSATENGQSKPDADIPPEKDIVQEKSDLEESGVKHNETSGLNVSEIIKENQMDIDQDNEIIQENNINVLGNDVTSKTQNDNFEPMEVDFHIARNLEKEVTESISAMVSEIVQNLNQDDTENSLDSEVATDKCLETGITCDDNNIVNSKGDTTKINKADAQTKESDKQITENVDTIENIPIQCVISDSVAAELKPSVLSSMDENDDKTLQGSVQVDEPLNKNDEGENKLKVTDNSKQGNKATELTCQETSNESLIEKTTEHRENDIIASSTEPAIPEQKSLSVDNHAIAEINENVKEDIKKDDVLSSACLDEEKTQNNATKEDTVTITVSESEPIAEKAVESLPNNQNSNQQEVTENISNEKQMISDDVEEVKIVEDVESHPKIHNERIPDLKTDTKEPQPIIKLSNTMDILSDDDEDEGSKGTPSIHKEEQKNEIESADKQCINIDDDDDVMLIDEDASKDDKKDTPNVDVKAQAEQAAETNNEANVVELDTSKEEEFKGFEEKDIRTELPKASCEGKDEPKLEPVKDSSEVPGKTAQLVPNDFFKTYRKNLADMTRDDLEEFCILKIVESIIDRSNLNEIRSKLKTMSQTIEEYKKKAIMLTKQNRDLQVVLKSVQEEQKKSTNQSITPLKIMRSVGMQVLMTDKNRRRPPGPTCVNSPIPGNMIQMNNNVNNTNVTNNRQPRNMTPSPRGTPQKQANPPIPVPRLVPAAQNMANRNLAGPTPNNPPKTISVPNGMKITSPNQKAPEKRSHARVQAVTVDLTDDEPPVKVPAKNSPAPPVRLVNAQNLLAQRPQLPQAVNSPRKVFIPINLTGPAPQNVRQGQTVLLKTPSPQGPRPRGQVGLPAIRPKPSNVPLKKLHGARHPAPLPDAMKQYQPPNWKALPPAPDLKLSKVENGIVISWKIEGYQEDSYEDIASYQLYAYQETSAPPSTSLWKKIGDVKALPLPMACTLTQFMAGYKYYFAVRAVDIRSRLGPFSLPGSILLLNKV